MRISDWSSDVCSSDRTGHGMPAPGLVISTILLLPMAKPNGRLDHGATLVVIDRVQRCVSMRKETDQHRAPSMRSAIAILIGSPEGPGPRHRAMGCPAIPQGHWYRHATSLRTEEHTSEI